MTSTFPAKAPDPTVKYYRSRQSAGVWTAGAVFIAVISVGPSLGLHSALLTGTLLFGIIIVWLLGYWTLSKNLYFVSSTKAGFKDLFRNREVQFAEVRSATIVTNSYGQTTSMNLIFQCAGEFGPLDVSMPLDPLNEPWLSDVKTELAKRGITVTTKNSWI